MSADSTQGSPSVVLPPRALAPPRSVFVGRERELAELEACVDQAVARHGALFLLSGEPGIGKTRLAQELAGRAAARGARVLWGRCWEGEGAPAYWPWVQVLRSHVRSSEPETLRAEVGSGAAHVAQILPDLRERLPEIPEPAVSLSPDSEHRRFYLFDSTTTFLRNAAKDGALVLVLEDMHCADRPSLMLLRFLSRELRDVSLLILGTYRDIEVKRSPYLVELFAELGRDAGRLSLRGLSEPEVATYIEETIGSAAPQPLAGMVHRATEGNPLFVGEVLRMLAAEGALDGAEAATVPALRIPDGVRDTIRRRMQPLSEGCRKVLSIASVLGRDFEVLPLQRVCGEPLERLLDLLGEAVDAVIVTDISTTLGRLRFSHTLMRDTLYNDLPYALRVKLHHEIGRALETIYGTNPDRHLAELAHHFLAAGAGGDPDKAIDYAARAGGHALRLLAYEEAALQFEHALTALDLKGGSNEEQRCELLLGLAEAQNKAGQIEEATRTFQRAAEIAKRLGSAERLARAALGINRPWLEERARGKVVLGLLEEAEGALGNQDSVLRSRLLARLAEERPWAERAPLAQQAVEMARRTGDRMALAHALISSHFAHRAPGLVKDRLATALQIAELAEETGDGDLRSYARVCRIADLAELGDLSALDREIDQFAAEAEELRLSFYRWQARAFRAVRVLLDGRLEEAERLILETVAFGRQAGITTAEHAAGSQLFQLRRAQGRLEELEATTRSAADLHPTIGSYRARLAFLYGELNRTTEARTELESLARDDFAGISKDVTWSASLAYLSEACALLEDPDRALKLYEALLPHAPFNLVISGSYNLGSASHYLGLLAATMSRRDDAARHFEDALQMNAKLNARPCVARTMCAYASLRLAGGERGKALELLAEAARIGAEVGMKSLIEKTSMLRASARGGKETKAHQLETKPPPPADENAFRREGEYWTIAFEGTTIRLKDSKGLRYIAWLLQNEGRRLLAAELLASEGPEASAVIAVGEQHPERGLHHGPGDSGEMLDLRARDAYRRRLGNLRADLKEARSCNDFEGADRAEREIEFLVRELARGTGLDGSPRRAGSAAERARLNVSRAIQGAVAKIADQHPSLGHHLAASILTGTTCSYASNPRDPVSWQF